MSIIRKPSELSVQTSIKTLIYGQPGIGKTTMALSAPSPLLLDYDGGVHRVNPIHQTDTVQVSSWDDTLEVLEENLSDYKTIVIDTAGKMLDYLSAYIISNDPKMGRRDGALTLQGYGSRKVAFVNFLKQVSSLNKHLVFVAHDKEEKDGDSRFIRPEIGGSSGGDLVKELDLVGYMEAIGKKRTISFDPCEKFYGKNTCNLESLIRLPELKDGHKNNFLIGVFDTYHNALESRKKIASDYADLMEVINEKITSIEDAETANEVMRWAVKFDEWIWDAKLQASHAIKDRTNGLGIKLNIKTKKYEDAKQPA